MLQIKHSDAANEDYFFRLANFVNQTRQPSDSAKYLLVVPKGAKAKRSARHIGEILLLLIDQPDWDEVILDQSFDESREEVWESFGTLSMTLKEATHLKTPAVRLKRISSGAGHHEHHEHHEQRHAVLSWKCFSPAPVRKRKSSKRPLPFSYFVAAVALTSTFCYLLYMVTGDARPGVRTDRQKG